MKHSGCEPSKARSVRRIRVDVPPGLAANPQAPMPKCAVATFNANPKNCPASSEVGTTEMEAIAEPLGIPLALPSLSGTVYNLEPTPGLPLDFGIAVEPAGELVSPIRLLLEGHVAWGSDYHEYFEINNVPNEATVDAVLPIKAPLKLLKSKLNFNGQAGGNFLTLPSVCSSTTVSYLELESYAGEIAHSETHTPVGVTGCENVPFAPSTTVSPETTQSDAGDGATTVVQVPQFTGPTQTNTSDIQNAHVTLPEGLTLNPSAAHGLEACTPEQIGIGTTHAGRLPGRLADRHRHDRNRSAAGIADRPGLPRRPGRQSDHRSAVHDLPRRRRDRDRTENGAGRRLGAPAGHRSRRTPKPAASKSPSRTTRSSRSANCA